MASSVASFKKCLLKPADFYSLYDKKILENKACFTFNYDLYGYVDTWSLFLQKLNEMSKSQREKVMFCHELIIQNKNVKPYLDVEWLESKFPDYDKDKILQDIIAETKKIFDEIWFIELSDDDFYISECHREIENNGIDKKYSFHIIIHNITDNNVSVFKNTNSASFYAKELRNRLKDRYDKSIIDIAVYGKSQRFRVLGHYKPNGSYSFKKIDENKADINFFITYFDKPAKALQAPEQEIEHDDIVNKNSALCLDSISSILESVKQKCYKTAKVIKKDDNDFIQMNYDHTVEDTCFFSDGKNKHDKIGFFVFVKEDGIIYGGCHSGNCVDIHNNRIILPIDKLNINNKKEVERVSKTNDTSGIHYDFIINCLTRESIGLSDLFSAIFLENPKRIVMTKKSKEGEIYFWNGELWEPDEFSFVERLMVDILTRVIIEFKNNFMFENPNYVMSITKDNKFGKKIAGLISSLNNGRNISSIKQFIKYRLNTPYFDETRDIHPRFFACNNGLVCLRTGAIRHFIPEDNITKKLKVSYKPDANYELLENLIADIMRNSDGHKDPIMYDYFKWIIGYCLQGDPKKKLFVILYGEKGNNGKSLLINTISQVIQHYSVEIENSVLFSSNSRSAGSHSSELVRTKNVRFGTISDIKYDTIIDDGKIKKITGGTDYISAREIFCKQEEFKPVFVPFINCNYRPRINLKDEALFNRLVIFPFLLSFVDNPDPNNKWERKRDEDLFNKFESNKEGTLKWLVDACIFYSNNEDGVEIPQTVLEEKIKYRKEMDDISDFIYTYYDKTEDDEDMVRKVDLLQLYKQYCKDNSIAFNMKRERLKFDNVLECGDDNATYIRITTKKLKVDNLD
jgi:P4 family phage/plasmid primase-like protien